jgi:DNA-binding SARP family transcriptional activator
MSQLQLLLLGTPIVKHSEHILAFSTRKALALLVYLAVEGGTHTRKTLSESFWPELDAEHGRAALRATLLEMRKLLERSHGPVSPLTCRSNAIRLESSRAASPFWIFSSSNLPASKQDAW